MAHVLVIDDNPEICSILQEALEDAGYDVIVAGNGRAGVERYLEGGVDLVITDIFMPEQDGIETILELRRANPDVKIIAMSGGGSVRDFTYLPAARQLGAVHSMAKPFDVHEVLATVRQLLSG